MNFTEQAKSRMRRFTSLGRPENYVRGTNGPEELLVFFEHGQERKALAELIGFRSLAFYKPVMGYPQIGVVGVVGRP